MKNKNKCWLSKKQDMDFIISLVVLTLVNSSKLANSEVVTYVCEIKSQDFLLRFHFLIYWNKRRELKFKCKLE